MPKSSYARMRLASVVDSTENDNRHPLLRIATKLIEDGILRDNNPLRFIRARDQEGSPAGCRHNEIVEKVLDASVLNCYRRSLEETDFETKSRWTDVFRKLEDGPGLNKKTFKYHCAIKDRAEVKEYYRGLVYIRLKTWVHAAICRAVAPFVPELREFRCFSYSGEHTLMNPLQVIAGMTKLSEEGAPFETWCKADIQGERRYRSAAEKQKHLQNNKSLYVVRYVGPSYGLDVGPSANPEAHKLLMRMASTFPGFCAQGNKNLADTICNEFVGKIPRRRWGNLFCDSEWFWGHGRVMSFPIHLGKKVPDDPLEIFWPKPEIEHIPVKDHTPQGFVYNYNAALKLVTSVDCLREIVKIGSLGNTRSTEEERARLKKVMFTPCLITEGTEKEACLLLRKLNKLQKSKLGKKPKKRLKQYCALVKSDTTQWHFFVRLTQMLKLNEDCTMAEIYGS